MKFSDGKEYETTVGEDVERDSILKQKIVQAKKDIIEGNVFSNEEVKK